MTTTPNDKAKELYDKMYKHCTMTIAGASSIWKPLVKQQCIVVIDEIIEALEVFGYSNNCYDHEETGKMTCVQDESPCEWWLKVKEEINQL